MAANPDIRPSAAKPLQDSRTRSLARNPADYLQMGASSPHRGLGNQISTYPADCGSNVLCGRRSSMPSKMQPHRDDVRRRRFVKPGGE